MSDLNEVYEQIKELENVQGISKHEQIVQGVLNAIKNKCLIKGDLLPSVNSLIQSVGFARETVSKGYKELIDRGIIESKNRVGFFVVNDDVNQQLRVALVLFAFDTFQESFYKTFRKKLGAGVQIDVFFHHNNIDVFDSIITKLRGKYGAYVIAPIPHERTTKILNVLPKQKFCMIDRYEAIGGDYSYVVQEFEDSSYKVFETLATVIKGYEGGMVYYHRPHSDTPVEILNAFRKFVKNNNIKSEIKPEYLSGSIEKGKVYYTINNTELWLMLKDCKEKNYEIGRDVGILSHNDDLVKEIICDGITTYSTDFKLMAERAAAFVLTQERVQEVIPTQLIRRKSL